MELCTVVKYIGERKDSTYPPYNTWGIVEWVDYPRRLVGVTWYGGHFVGTVDLNFIEQVDVRYNFKDGTVTLFLQDKD